MGKDLKQLVLEHMQKYGSISSKTAFELYGNTRLSSSIYSLRQDGYNIISTECEELNRYGKKTRFVKYSLGKDKSNEDNN